MNTNEIKKTLYEVLKGSPVTPGYDIEIWKDAHDVPPENCTSFKVSNQLVY